ncbi:hypothetical protein BKA59DRAFT_534879 [Fusarium tricinctum]|uniref:Fungal N-terminal domain-containing protein n=1 Tax=Fusarium tricinctum TaxID=61284 RepID=A0A8K0W5T4_9HYPO|nr:hypothetical protein BKA59DRAFT_534879 [Fusarium tricinctum]
MADPLSVASGVAGLVSLGLTLCNGLHNYFSAIKDRHSDIKTATQSLALLESNICIIQSSTLKLGHRHALAANGVNAGLKNCETQLKALEVLVKTLDIVENSSGIKQKWQKQKMFVRYPFDQKNLLKLQEYLSRANATLGSFVQSFNLDINIGISEDLQVLRRDLHDNGSTIQSMLRAIASQLHTISLASQPTSMEVTTCLSQMGGQATSASREPGPTQPLFIRNSGIEKELCRNYLAMECTCPNFANNAVYNHSSHSYQMWGGLTISKQISQQKKHRPGCHLYRSLSKGSSRTTLTYFGLRYLFSCFISISLKKDLLAGAYSLSFGLRFYNVVETSPAFHIFSYDYSDGSFNSEIGRYFDRFGLQATARIILQQLRVIYDSGNASPFDVDARGNNIAYFCIDTCLSYLVTRNMWKFNDTMMESISMLLSYMFDIGVPVTTFNFHQG